MTPAGGRPFSGGGHNANAYAFRHGRRTGRPDDASRRRWGHHCSCGFDEWKNQRGSKQQNQITPVDDQPFAFAGRWGTHEVPSGDVCETVTITTDANEVVADVHDRMPVMVERCNEQTWLTVDDHDVQQGVLDQYTPDDL